MYKILIFFIVCHVVVSQRPNNAQQSESVSSNHRCGANQKFYECGACVGTCKTPKTVCTLQCVLPGNCGCLPGYVKDTNDGGKCVPENSRQCVAQREHSPQRRCGKTERFYACGACDATCVKPNRACTKECRPGECGCLAGFVRNARLRDRCVPRNSQQCLAQRRL